MGDQKPTYAELEATVLSLREENRKLEEFSDESHIECLIIRKHLRLAARILSIRHERMASRICDDIDPEWLKDFSQEELVAANREFHEFNGDPEESFEKSGILLDLQASSYAFWLSMKYADIPVEKERNPNVIASLPLEVKMVIAAAHAVDGKDRAVDPAAYDRAMAALGYALSRYDRKFAEERERNLLRALFREGGLDDSEDEGDISAGSPDMAARNI